MSVCHWINKNAPELTVAVSSSVVFFIWYQGGVRCTTWVKPTSLKPNLLSWAVKQIDEKVTQPWAGLKTNRSKHDDFTVEPSKDYNQMIIFFMSNTHMRRGLHLPHPPPFILHFPAVSFAAPWQHGCHTQTQLAVLLQRRMVMWQEDGGHGGWSHTPLLPQDQLFAVPPLDCNDRCGSNRKPARQTSARSRSFTLRHSPSLLSYFLSILLWKGRICAQTRLPDLTPVSSVTAATLSGTFSSIEYSLIEILRALKQITRTLTTDWMRWKCTFGVQKMTYEWRNVENRFGEKKERKLMKENNYEPACLAFHFKSSNCLQ